MFYVFTSSWWMMLLALQYSTDRNKDSVFDIIFYWDNKFISNNKSIERIRSIKNKVILNSRTYNTHTEGCYHTNAHIKNETTVGDLHWRVLHEHVYIYSYVQLVVYTGISLHRCVFATMVSIWYSCFIFADIRCCICITSVGKWCLQLTI